jgi:hypothetical protein
MPPGDPDPQSASPPGPSGAAEQAAGTGLTGRDLAEPPRAGPTPLFLHRDTYRRRRIMDAARLLPLFGTALLLMPLLWADDHATASGAVYLFLAWFVLIAAAGLLSRRLSAPLRARDGARAARPGEQA